LRKAIDIYWFFGLILRKNQLTVKKIKVTIV
jgi:hypothetical protein